ncbi:MAG: dCMP deaminase family protein [Clostridia bacterium]
MNQRTDYISWDEYFMGIAKLSCERSKDPNTGVGACIVDTDHKIVSVGYNGMPIGIDDDLAPWNREGSNLETKYFYVCHSELNAILNSKRDLNGCIMYVSLFPCNECAKAIVQSGIKKVIYYEDKYKDQDIFIASKKIFDMAGIEYVEYTKTNKEIIIKL